MIGQLLKSGSILAKMGSAALVLLLLWQVWDVFSPKKPELPFLRKQVADQTVGRLITDLPRVDPTKTVVVLRFANDNESYVSAQVHDRLQASGRYRLLDDTLWQKIQKELGIENRPIASLSEALDVGRKTGADVAVFGELRVFEMTETVASIDMFARLVDLRSETVLFAQRYQDTLQASPLSIPYVGSRIAETSLPRRAVIGLLFVLLLPWLTMQALVSILKRQSNTANAGLILAYTLTDALGVFVLMGFDTESWFSVVVFLVAVGFSAIYNAVVANYVAGLEV